MDGQQPTSLLESGVKVKVKLDLNENEDFKSQNIPVDDEIDKVRKQVFSNDLVC